MMKRLPEKRGFTNIFRTEYVVVKVGSLNRFDGEVTLERLVEEGLIKSLRKPVKILGDGELEKPLVVKANKFSQTARSKIEAAGGKVEEIGRDSGS